MKILISEKQLNFLLEEKIQIKDTNYSHVKYDLDATQNDYVNKPLLDDLNEAGKALNIVLTITTAKSGHNPYVKGKKTKSRHMFGTAVDISILNGISDGYATRSNYKKDFRELGNKIKNYLVNNLGYIWNVEYGNPKSVLWLTDTGGNHYNHLHISNRIGSESKDKTTKTTTTSTKSDNEKNEKFDELMDIDYDYNPDVVDLQKLLISKGYYIGRFGRNQDGVDGKYGPFTKAGHKAYLESIPPEKFESVRKNMAQDFIENVSDSTLKNEFNFHDIPGGGNNYRSAQIPITIKGKDFLGKVIDEYGIKNIIRLNYDLDDGRHKSSHPETKIEDEEKLAEYKGINFKKLKSSNPEHQKIIEDYLKQGNTLIHCAHGADRTGGAVGGYLKNSLGWTTEEIWKYTNKYNDWDELVIKNPSEFIRLGFLNNAKKFGVRDIEHAQQLAKGQKVTKVNNSKIPKNIVIGDSQAPYVAMNLRNGSLISKNEGMSSLWEGGKTVAWLIEAVSRFNISPQVKNVIIVIGTNGGFGRYTNDNIPGLFRNLKEKFPNAKFIVVQGSWGWTKGLSKVTEKEVRNYYKKFENEGAVVIETPIGNIEPHGNKPIYSTIGSEIEQELI
jgi:protein tyrosine/serine phosphatase